MNLKAQRESYRIPTEGPCPLERRDLTERQVRQAAFHGMSNRHAAYLLGVSVTSFLDYCDAWHIMPPRPIPTKGTNP